MSEETLVAPPLTITVGGTEIKMTYGLEMDIRRMLPDPATALDLAMSDPFTQDYILRRCLTPKKSMITNVEDLIPEDDVDITSEEMEQLLNWALEHSLYFFARRTKALGSLGVRYGKVLQNLSKDGSEASASTTQSAGDSESSKETSTTSTGDTPEEKSSSVSA